MNYTCKVGSLTEPGQVALTLWQGGMPGFSARDKIASREPRPSRRHRTWDTDHTRHLVAVKSLVVLLHEELDIPLLGPCLDVLAVQLQGLRGTRQLLRQQIGNHAHA